MANQTADVFKRLASEIDLLFAGSGHPSNWRQHSYRDAIFALYQSHPDLTGDRIREFTRELWPAASDERAAEKQKIFEDICTAWDEWRYARDMLSVMQ